MPTLFLETNSELRDVFKRSFKLKSAPRVTRVGAWLRKSGSASTTDQCIDRANEFGRPSMLTVQELNKCGEYQKLLTKLVSSLVSLAMADSRVAGRFLRRTRPDARSLHYAQDL
jgi:hypothetical protein